MNRQQSLLCQMMQMLHPLQKIGLSLHCIQQRRDPAKGIMQ